MYLIKIMCNFLSNNPRAEINFETYYEKWEHENFKFTNYYLKCLAKSQKILLSKNKRYYHIYQNKCYKNI